VLEHALGWTEPRVEKLKQLFAADPDMRRRDMAAEIGGVTKNAVIGKLLRLGLCGGDAPCRPRIRAPRAPRAPRPLRTRRFTSPDHAVVEPEPEVIEADIPIGQRCTLLQLNDENCHWPVGDPATPEFFFCGGKANAGTPYCGWHNRVAYSAPAARRDRRSAAWTTTAQGRWT